MAKDKRGGGEGEKQGQGVCSRGGFLRNALESFSRFYPLLVIFWGGGRGGGGEVGGGLGTLPGRPMQVACWSFLPLIFYFKYITIIYKYI